MLSHLFFFFFNDTATTEIYTRFYTLSLHDALPICVVITNAAEGQRALHAFGPVLNVEFSQIGRAHV